MIIDLLTVLLVSYGFYQGYTKGIIKTVFATLSLIVAVITALKLSPLVIKVLQGAIDINPAIIFVLGFVLTFIGTLALVRFIGDRLDKLTQSLHISGVNKALGGLVLGLFYAILLSYGVYFTDKVDLISDNQKGASFTYALLKPLPTITQDFGQSLRPLFSEFWDALIDTMDSIKAKGESIENK